MIWKLITASSLILLSAGYAVSEGWQRQDQQRQEAFCHQMYDWNISKYHQSGDVKYLRRLQFPNGDAKHCKTFFDVRL